MPSDKERLTLYRRLAAEYEEMPGQLDLATAALEKVLDIDAKAEDAYRSLAVSAVSAAEKWPELCATYERHLAHAEKGRGELLTALSRVYEVDIPAGDEQRRREEAPKAIAAWQKLLDMEPSTPVRSRRWDGFISTEQPAEAVRLLVKRAHLTDDKISRRTCTTKTRRGCVCASWTTAAAPKNTWSGRWKFCRVMLRRRRRSRTCIGTRGDHLRAAKLLAEASESSQNRLDKGRFVVQAAKELLLGEDRQKPQICCVKSWPKIPSKATPRSLCPSCIGKTVASTMPCRFWKC